MSRQGPIGPAKTLTAPTTAAILGPDAARPPAR